MIEDWLLKNEKYSADSSRDSFIEKTIISFFKIIKNIRKNENNNGFLYQVNTSLKVLTVFIDLFLILCSKSFIYLGILNIFLFVFLFTVNYKERGKILLSSFIFPMFTFIILIPSMFNGNIYNGILMIYKVFLNIFLVNIFLSYTSTWQNLAQSLKLFLIPDIFIWIFELTIKYILILGEYTIETLQALKLRSVGRNTRAIKSLFLIMGNMFLNSVKLSEETFDAMTCRGFNGEYIIDRNQKVLKIDIIYFLINFLFIIFFCIF